MVGCRQDPIECNWGTEIARSDLCEQVSLSSTYFISKAVICLTRPKTSKPVSAV